MKGLNGQVRDRLIAPTRHRTYWLKKQAKERRDSLTEVLSIFGKGIYLFEGRYSCTGIEVIRTELSLPARNEEATDAICGQSKGQIEEWFTSSILSIN